MRTDNIDERTALILRERGFGDTLIISPELGSPEAFRIQVYLDGQINESFPINDMFLPRDIASAVYRTNLRHLVNEDANKIAVRVIDLTSDICVVHLESGKEN